MTLNDIELNELCLKIRTLSRQLPKLMADAKEQALFMALSDIEKAANKAQVRLNERKYQCS